MTDRRPGNSDPRISLNSPSFPQESDSLNAHEKTASSSINRLEKSHGNSAGLQKIHTGEWLPYTLRASLIWIPTALSVILALVVGLLYWRSNTNNGLSPEASAITGWRFAPTLVAVLYAQLMTMLFNDIQRTEPFARLARSPRDVPPASRTILEGPRQIWTTFAHAFNKKHNGGKRSWIIIWSSLVCVLSSVIISLSSALLSAEETNIWRPAKITRMVPRNDSTIKPLVERDTYFRTTGAILQNVTTSPWISDEYSILPFWPSDDGPEVSHWDAKSSSIAQTWEAETTVFRTDLQCSPLELAATDTIPYTHTRTGSPETDFLLSIRLENAEGCKYNLTFNASEKSDFNNWQAGSWSDLDSYVIEGRYAHNSLAFQTPLRPSYNDKCQGDEFIFMSSQWISNQYYAYQNMTAKFVSNLTVTSYICQSNFTMARLPVRVSTSVSGFDVNFDVDAFKNAQQQVPPSTLNSSQFVASLTDPKWFTIIPRLAGGPGLSSGVMALLATHYNFDFYKMKNDTKMPEQAARLQRRHFGEVLRSSLDVGGASQNEGVAGMTMVSERRIVVRMEAAASMVALFVFCFFTMLGISWLSRVGHRPLNLTHEPATVLGTVSLVSSNLSALSSLRDLDQASTAELKSSLKGRYFSTFDGYLDEVHKNGVYTAPTPKIPSPAEKESPGWVKIRVLLSLILYIALLIMAITVVHRFATNDLKKGFFTYRLNVNSLGRLGSFTPFSIIPTTLAVLLGLWWNALDTTFRSLQPYVAMSQAPRDISRGANVSYQSSYWLWATGKAAKNGHWLLSLVTFGTFLAQAFTIATSALFEQTNGVITDSVQLNRSLELRQMPHIRQVTELYPPQFGGYRAGYGYPYVGETLTELFGNLTNNWLYSGVIQATMNTTEPNWGMDGWSFVPVDLSALDSEHKNTNGSGSDNLDAYDSLVNITMTTPAIRGRVECTSFEEIRNGSTKWASNVTLTDTKTNKTVRGVALNYQMFGGPMAPDAMTLSCCYNTSDPSRGRNPPSPVAVGFWTQDFGNSSEFVSATLNNFTVKWIYGDGADLSNFVSDFQSLYFPKLPKIQAVKCMPIFETSEAEVVVDKLAGRVLSYRLLSEPLPDDSAWSDSFVFHDPTDPNDPVLKKQIKESEDACDPEFTCYPTASQNMTTSYGVLFINSLLRASRLDALSNSGVGHGSRAMEKLDDNVFNIRDNVTGLSLDFMSYAAYVQAGRNPEALLNQTYMIESTQKIFTTFFQHFVSSNYSLASGGWAYQPIGANIKGLGDFVNGTFPQYNPDGTPAVKVADLPAENTQRVATATMATRVEVLRMNENAVWLCVALLGWLVVTTIIVAALQRWFFGELRRNVESIADVLVLVAGSERLLTAVERYGAEGLMKSNVKTRLGWFRTDDGKMRWGIEIVEDGEVLMN